MARDKVSGIHTHSDSVYIGSRQCGQSPCPLRTKTLADPEKQRLWSRTREFDRKLDKP
jgi:hypothetical protein